MRVMRQHVMQRSAGLTMVEIVVIAVAVIAVIVILLPIWGSSSERRADSLCKANLTQLAFGFNSYANDYGGYAPHREIESSWDTLIWPYLTDETVYECPKDQWGYYLEHDSSYKWRSTAVVDPEHPERAMTGRNLIEARPRILLLVFDASHSWHEAGYINAATLDGDAKSVELEEYEQDLRTRPE